MQIRCVVLGEPRPVGFTKGKLYDVTEENARQWVVRNDYGELRTIPKAEVSLAHCVNNDQLKRRDMEARGWGLLFFEDTNKDCTVFFDDTDEEPVLPPEQYFKICLTVVSEGVVTVLARSESEARALADAEFSRSVHCQVEHQAITSWNLVSSTYTRNWVE